MSIQRAQELVQYISDNDEFRKTLAKATNYEERKGLIDGAGFADVTLEDMKEVQSAAVRAEELNDAELEAVAGGRSASWTVVIATTIGSIIVGAATVGLIP